MADCDMAPAANFEPAGSINNDIYFNDNNKNNFHECFKPKVEEYPLQEEVEHQNLEIPNNGFKKRKIKVIFIIIIIIIPLIFILYFILRDEEKIECYAKIGDKTCINENLCGRNLTIDNRPLDQFYIVSNKMNKLIL